MKRLFFSDLDGTVALLTPVVKEKIKRVFGLDVKNEDIYVYGPNEHNLPGVTEEQAEAILTFFIEFSTYGQASPYPHSNKVLQRIYQNGEFGGYITRRQPSSEAVSRYWLQKHGYPGGPIYHPMQPRSKAAVVPLHIQADEVYLIEDSLHEAKQFVQYGHRFKSILLKPGSNRSEIITKSDWLEILDWYNSIQ